MKIANNRINSFKLDKFSLRFFLLIRKIRKKHIIGTIPNEYSISCLPNGIIDMMFSLKKFSSTLKKNEEKKIFIQLKKEVNSVGGYCRGKLDRKNKLENILDKEMEKPKSKDCTNL